MEKKIYEEKREDYIALFEALEEMLNRFEDYTPDRQQELNEITKKACENAQDIPSGPKLFEIMANYIIYRYEELKSFRERRKADEQKLLKGLLEIFDNLAVPSDDSCRILSETVEKYSSQNNYQILAEGIIKKIAAL